MHIEKRTLVTPVQREREGGEGEKSVCLSGKIHTYSGVRLRVHFTLDLRPSVHICMYHVLTI